MKPTPTARQYCNCSNRARKTRTRARITRNNSPYQLGRLVSAAKGKTAALASQDEYTFFRSRYAKGDKDETAFLVLTDATIRRWCGPRWRIGSSRRTQVAAVLAEMQAAHLEE